MKKPEDYALLWANGMSFGDVIRLHAHDLAEEIREVDRYNDFTAQYAADLIDPEG